MADVIHCNLDELGDVLAGEADRYVEDLRGRLTEGVTFIQVEMARQAPRHAGDFAASIQPYVGEPKETWERGSGGQTAGASEVEAAMRDWKPGEECGVATDAPYSRKLIHHAGEDRTSIKRVHVPGRKRVRRVRGKATYTKKVPAGWVDTIVLQANRLMEDE